MPRGLQRKNLGHHEVSALCGGWRVVCTTASPSFPSPACDVHTLSCPPLSIHLHHSHPTPFLCHQLQPALLPLSINLSPPSVSSPLSVCLFHPLISSFLSESLLSLLLPSFFPHSIISPHMSASPLFFVTHFPYPTFFPPSFSLPRPYLSSAFLLY